MSSFDANTWLEWMSPHDKIYTGFGDGSVLPGAALYGIVLIPTALVSDLELSLGQLKLKFGGTPNATIHCREIFNSTARSKGPWSHLDDESVVSLLSDCFLAAKEAGVRYMVAFSPEEYFPKKLRLLGRNGHQDLVHDIDNNWITLNLFQGLASYFDPQTILVPPDYKSNPRPRNEPFWQKIAQRNFLGAVIDQLYIDREQAKIRWFSKSFQWATVARDLVVDGPKGRSLLPIVPPKDKKHTLLELADMFVYAIGRDLTGRPLPFRGLVSDDVFLENVGVKTHELVYGMPEDIAAYRAKSL